MSISTSDSVSLDMAFLERMVGLNTYLAKMRQLTKEKMDNAADRKALLSQLALLDQTKSQFATLKQQLDMLTNLNGKICQKHRWAVQDYMNYCRKHYSDEADTFIKSCIEKSSDFRLNYVEANKNIVSRIVHTLMGGCTAEEARLITPTGKRHKKIMRLIFILYKLRDQMASNPVDDSYDDMPPLIEMKLDSDDGPQIIIRELHEESKEELKSCEHAPTKQMNSPIDQAQMTLQAARVAFEKARMELVNAEREMEEAILLQKDLIQYLQRQVNEEDCC